MREFDKDGSRDLDFKEFSNILLPIYTGQFDDEEIRYAFKIFDRDNKGYLTVGELKQVLSKLGHHFTTTQIQRFVSSVDTSKDGRLNFQGKFKYIIFDNLYYLLKFHFHFK